MSQQLLYYKYLLLHTETGLAILVGLGVAVLAGLIGAAISRRSRRQPQSRPLVYRDAPRSRSDPFMQGPSHEARSSVRRKGSVVRVVLADAKLKQIGEGWVIDRSTGGLGLYMDEPLEVGTEISICPSDRQHDAPWVRVVVKSHHKEEDHWKVGCQFLRTPPWSVLLLFG